MAYPCIVHGVCEFCETEVANGKWCKNHQIFHWRGDPCPLCRMNEPDCTIKEMIVILEGGEV